MKPNTEINKAIILVVEDDDISYFLVQEILASFGMKAVRAKSKDEVMQLIEAKADFQMIIMDVMLDGSDNGYSIACELAAMQINLPIMIVSAWATAVLKPDRSKIKNIKEVLDKPFNVDNFKELLIKTLKKIE
jgi:CheY-like chemotaxis protein